MKKTCFTLGTAGLALGVFDAACPLPPVGGREGVISEA